MRIICVNTGNKFSEWYVKNLKHMIDMYSGLKYNSFEVIRKNKFEGVFNKLQMFNDYKEGENLYFDLDIVIKNTIPNLIRKDFTVLKAWWRKEFHTPLNSSIISWTGDVSHIYDKFIENPNYYMLKYNRGIDQFIHENIKYNTYDKVCYSIQNNEYEKENKEYSICLFNQRRILMEEGWTGWWKNYFIPYS